MRGKFIALGAAVATVAIIFGAPSAQAAGTGQVTVIHGVRGLLADVYVDGKIALSSFAPQRITDPITLPAGAHKVEIRQHGAAANSAPVVSATLQVSAGAHLSAAAGLHADGSPLLWQYDDNALAPLLGHGASGSGIEIRNVAATPAVQAVIDGKTVDVPVAPGQNGISVTSGKHLLSLKTTSGASALPAEQVTTEPGRVTVVYLYGAAKDSSLAWLAETVQPGVTAKKAATPPKKVDTGNSGLAAPPTDGIGALGLVLLIGATAVVRERRLRRP
jgi:hypothetical protein